MSLVFIIVGTAMTAGTFGFVAAAICRAAAEPHCPKCALTDEEYDQQLAAFVAAATATRDAVEPSAFAAITVPIIRRAEWH